MARKIWEWAEVGYQEKRSSALLADALEEGGFRVERGVAGIPTAFIATIGSGKPVIGILGEYDALPGLSQQAEPVRRARPGSTAGHGCGHHLFGTASAAACLALAEQVKAGTIKGTLRFYGCPAEEGGSAKAFMVRAHLFDDCDAVLHWHPSSENATGDVSSQARIAAKFRFHGTSCARRRGPRGRPVGPGRRRADESRRRAAPRAHAGLHADPPRHHGRRRGAERRPRLRRGRPTTSATRKAEVVRALYARLVKCAEAGALATETRLETQYLGGIVEIVPNQAIGRVARMNLERLDDLQLRRARDRVRGRDPQDAGRDAALTAAGEPVARGRSHRPGRHGLDRRGRRLVGRADGRVHRRRAGCPGTSAHSWQAVAAGGTTIGRKGMILAARTLAATAWDLFQSPRVLQAARDEHRRRLAGHPYHSLLGPDQKPPLDYRNAPARTPQ